MFVLLICVTPPLDIESINNVQGENYAGESFVNIKHVSVQRAEGNPLGCVYKIPLLL